MAAFVTTQRSFIDRPDPRKSSPVNVSGMDVMKFPRCNLDAGCARTLARQIVESRALANLNLDYNPLGDLGVEVISDAITKKLTLRHLYMTEVGMTERGMYALAKAIETLNKLVLLTASGNKYGDEGVSAISRALMGKNTLSLLSLHSVGMTSKGMHELAQTIATLENLSHLDIRWNVIGDEGVRTLSRSLEGSKVRELHLAHVGITDASMLQFSAALMKMPCLAVLEITGAQLSEEGFASMREGLNGRSLSHLHLPSINAAAVLFMSEPPAAISSSSTVNYIIRTTPPVDVSNMTKLNLQGCGINENCFPALARLSTSINTLVLDNNPLGDIGVRALSKALGATKMLTQLNLINVGMTSVGMSILSETLPNLELLTSLAVNQNQIGDDGVRSLTKVMHSSSKIHALLLRNVGMTDDSVPEFCSALPNLANLDNLWIDNNEITTEESFIWLRQGLSGRKMNFLFDPREEASVLFRDYETEAVAEDAPGSSSDE